MRESKKGISEKEDAKKAKEDLQWQWLDRLKQSVRYKN